VEIQVEQISVKNSAMTTLIGIIMSVSMGLESMVMDATNTVKLRLVIIVLVVCLDHKITVGLIVEMEEQ
jgi:hypothetical protein